MKFHKFFWLCLILCLILVGGCRKASVTSALKSPTEPTILPGTSTRTPVSTLPPSPTHTLTPTATFTIAPTHTPTPSSTPTAIPTLSIEDAHARLLELLADNGGCRLPCLWGIMPGETTYQEGQVLLAPFAGISNFTAFKSGIGNITPYIVLDDLIVYISVDILAKNNIVTQVHFSGAAYREMVDQRLVYALPGAGDQLHASLRQPPQPMGVRSDHHHRYIARWLGICQRPTAALRVRPVLL